MQSQLARNEKQSVARSKNSELVARVFRLKLKKMLEMLKTEMILENHRLRFTQ